jgi:hypothetical protein
MVNLPEVPSGISHYLLFDLNLITRISLSNQSPLARRLRVALLFAGIIIGISRIAPDFAFLFRLIFSLLYAVKCFF